MIVSYKKLSEGDEKSLSEIINAENTYIAAFKEGEKNYKVPIADFNNPQDNNKVYKFTARRIYGQHDTQGTLVIYDEDGEIINGGQYKDYDSGIEFFEYLYDAGYTILINVEDDNKMPYYKFKTYDLPVCTFRLSSTYVYSYTNHRVFNFTFTEAQNNIINAIYTITIRSESAIPFATMNYQNPYARIPTMAFKIGLNNFRDYPECLSHGNGGLPVNITESGQSILVSDLAFSVFLWDQDFGKNNKLILDPPSQLQQELRAEFIIVWVNAYCTTFSHSMDGHYNILDEPHCNIVTTPSIINPNVTNDIKLITDYNDDDCGNYALFKITAIGYGWEVTPLYNCQLYSHALYYGTYAYNDID